MRKVILLKFSDLSEVILNVLALSHHCLLLYPLHFGLVIQRARENTAKWQKKEKKNVFISLSTPITMPQSYKSSHIITH